jgi:hypothetical protein
MTTTTQPARLLIDHDDVKKVGHWTTERAFDVKIRHGAATLDLRSHQIPDGDVEINVDIDHGMLKLLVPDGATVDSWDVTFVGRGRVKDWQRAEARSDGRVIRLVGSIRRGEVRINRGGIAVLSAMMTKEFIADARRAHQAGTTPVVADPSHRD